MIKLERLFKIFLVIGVLSPCILGEAPATNYHYSNYDSPSPHSHQEDYGHGTRGESDGNSGHNEYSGGHGDDYGYTDLSPNSPNKYKGHRGPMTHSYSPPNHYSAPPPQSSYYTTSEVGPVTSSYGYTQVSPSYPPPPRAHSPSRPSHRPNRPRVKLPFIPSPKAFSPSATYSTHTKSYGAPSHGHKAPTYNTYSSLPSYSPPSYKSRPPPKSPHSSHYKSHSYPEESGYRPKSPTSSHSHSPPSYSPSYSPTKFSPNSPPNSHPGGKVMRYKGYMAPPPSHGAKIPYGYSPTSYDGTGLAVSTEYEGGDESYASHAPEESYGSYDGGNSHY